MKKINKKGFTLIELLAVITLIAIIAVIAVPNIVKMVDNSKREEFVSDATNMISQTKYMYNFVDGKYSNVFTLDGTCYSIKLNDLVNIDIDVDADGNEYDKDYSGTKVCIENNTLVYYVRTMSKDDQGFNTRGIYDSTSTGNYVLESLLSKDSINSQNE